MDAPVSLFHCPELRELEYFDLSSRKTLEATTSSITSLNIQKIIFSTPLACYASRPLEESRWPTFDDCVSALADKLFKMGYKETLEVEFRFEPVFMNQTNRKKFLPKFREKGRVTIMNIWKGRDLKLTVCFFSFVLCRHL